MTLYNALLLLCPYNMDNYYTMSLFCPFVFTKSLNDIIINRDYNYTT